MTRDALSANELAYLAAFDGFLVARTARTPVAVAEGMRYTQLDAMLAERKVKIAR